jgi:AcrR family transcriptional regulator
VVTAQRLEARRDAKAEGIKGVARRQMAAHGAATLSLRSVAAELGITAPAIYRYFPNRDALVTALIVDAYRALGAAVAGAEAGIARDDFGGRFLAAAVAYRRWSLDHNADFQLIFGTPIPGYHAPAEVTVPVVEEAFSPFALIPEAAWAAGRLRAVAAAGWPAAATDARLATWLRAERFTMPAPLLRLVLEGWGLMHGLVTLELIGHLPPLVGDPAEMYEAAIRSFLLRVGLEPSG